MFRIFYGRKCCHSIVCIMLLRDDLEMEIYFCRISVGGFFGVRIWLQRDDYGYDLDLGRWALAGEFAAFPFSCFPFQGVFLHQIGIYALYMRMPCVYNRMK